MSDPRDQAAYFSLTFGRRSVFGDRLKGSIGQVVSQLLLNVHLRTKIDGELISIADAARDLEIDDKSTMRNYVERAIRLGFVHEVEGHDTRVKLLALTEAGQEAVEKECDDIRRHLLRACSDITGDPKLRPRVTHANDPPYLTKRRSPAVSWNDQPDKLIKIYTDTLSVFPENRAALEKRAHALCRKREYAAAFKDIDKAIGLNPQNASAYIVRAWARGHLGQVEEGVADAKRAVEIEPYDATNVVYLAQYLQAHGRYAEAAEVWEGTGSGYVGHINDAAECYEKAGNLKAALRAYKQVHGHAAKELEEVRGWHDETGGKDITVREQEKKVRRLAEDIARVQKALKEGPKKKNVGKKSGKSVR